MPINFTGSYSQDFDTLATSGSNNAWANDSTLAGWSLFRQPVPGTAITGYNADNGGSNTGSFFSYGTTGSLERALGGLGSGGTYFGSPASGVVAGWIAFSATNTTGATINDLTVAFNGEQWRNGGNTAAQTMTLQYGFGSSFTTVSTWTTPGSTFNWASPVATSTAAAVDGNNAGRVSNVGGTLSGLSWANNDTLWFRWVETNDTGNDHGLAIDNFSLTTSTVQQPGVTITQTGGSTSVVEGGATDTYTIALNTTPVGAVDIAIAADAQTEISIDGINFSSSVTVSLTSTTPQTITVRAIDDTVLEATAHTGSITHTITTSADPAYSGLTIPNLTVSITDNDIPATLRIRDIQGIGHTSPLVGQTVSGVAGIVTAVASNGFYFQDPNPDTDDRTSEGLFVFTSSAPTVAVGDSVQVGGTVSEFRPGNNANNLTITQITGPSITVLSSGNPLPTATILGSGGRAIPTQFIDNDTTGNIETGATTFDPAQDGIDFYESLEGMLVQINNPVTSSPTAFFSASEEIWVLADNGANATSRTARGGSLITSTDFNPERIQIDDLINGAVTLPTVNVGAQLSTITGVVNYDFNNYEILVSTAPTVVQASPLQKEVTNLMGTASQLTVATFNVENLDPGDGAAKFNALANAIVNNLKSPDIISLEEIQDNNGATNDSVVDASVTYQTLINAIAAAGGPTYQYRQINPVDDTNGGEPGGNIRVGFLFNPQRVTFVDRPGGTSTSSTTVTDIGNDGIPDLSASPGLIDPTNSAFNASRKPLVGEFVFNGQTVYVIGNHFNSKGGDQPLFGPNQPPTLGSEVQRNQQATIVRNFVQSILAINPNANVIVAGDLNDFEFSNPLTILENGGLNTLVETLPANERYTYNFQGNAQVLDHILVSNNLFSRLDGFDVVHINSEFADQVSDHDPVVARFNIAAPIVNQPPTAVTLTNAVTTLVENTSTATRIKVADISITDDGVGTNTLSLGGADAAFFELDGNVLYLKAGTTLDFETKSSYAVTVDVDDTTVGSTPDASANYTLTLQDQTVESVNLSNYVRIGRYTLPEPTRTAAPTNSLLAQEVSAITYNWDTDTLFVVGDGGRSIVQITKQGQLIDSMTLALGTSPQGTEFYDTEGLSYIGNGQFVLVEERDRQVSLFTYAANTTLTRSNVQTVKLGTTIGNIGLEGISYDPLTGGYIAVKENTPQGIFQTGIDFAAGTATNGSPTTVNSTNLFDPALAGLVDLADVFALSNLPSLTGTADYDNLLVLSQESGKLINIDRAGNILSSLTIVSDPGNPLSVANQGFEGVTMDRNGFLYITSEEGGGDINHPQLWVYAPASFTYTNQAPVAVSIANPTASLSENTSTATRIKVGNIIISDDALGTNTLSLTGADASSFEVSGTELFLRAGVTLDFESKTSYNVTVNVNDPTVGGNPDATTPFTLAVTDITEAPSLIISEVAPWSSGNSIVGADWFEVTNVSTSAVNITGWRMDDESNSFTTAVALNGITSIAPGESVIFIESNSPATVVNSFKSVWFGSSASASLQIGTYTGSGVGLSTGGDAVNLFNATGTKVTGISFGASPSSAPFRTFDNAAGLQNTAVSTLSTAGVNGAFVATGTPNEIGSPGRIVNTAPVANDDSVTTTDLQAVVIPVLANDSDPDAGDTLAIASFTQTTSGSLVQNADNTFTYTPTPGFVGTDTFTYTIRDGGNLTATATVTLTVTQGTNQIVGTTGDDNLVGTSRDDVFRGLAGNDTYTVNNAGDVIIENPNEGTDLVRSSISFSIASFDHVENLTLTGSAAINGTGNGLDNVITGNTGTNILDGGAGNDNIRGGGGNDTLIGGAGDDTLNGGNGTDTFIGGSGNDLYIVDSASAIITELAGEGTDLVRSSVTFSIAPFDNVENLNLTGTSNINGTGNNANNVLTGNSGRNQLVGLDGNDTLDGQGGRDILIGGAGDDLYLVDTTFDVVTELANEGIDRVQSIVSWTLGNHLENLTLTGSGAINGTGNALDNELIGNNGANRLDGANGNDTLMGGNGSDILIGGAGDDVLVGGNGNDRLTGGTGSDRFVFNAFAERNDTITDFNFTQDILDLSGVFDYLGSTPIDDTYLRFRQSGSNTVVQVDLDGTLGGANFNTLVTLNGVASSRLAIGSNVLV